MQEILKEMEKILDNREKIMDLLKFGDNTYYYLQILQRRKENPDLPQPEIKRWKLFINGRKSLKNADPYIEFLCKSLNARAYISILPRDLRKYTAEVIKSFVERIEEENYNQCFRIGDRVALSSKTVKWRGIIPKSRLLLDFDKPEKSQEEIIEFLRDSGFTLEDVIPTKNGFHVITENCCPEKLLGTTKSKDENVKSEKGGFSFTIIRECNTLYYAKWEEEK